MPGCTMEEGNETGGGGWRKRSGAKAPRDLWTLYQDRVADTGEPRSEYTSDDAALNAVHRQASTLVVDRWFEFGLASVLSTYDTLKSH